MSGPTNVTPAPAAAASRAGALLESLHEAQSRLPDIGRAALREALAPALQGFQRRLEPAEARAAIDTALGICRRLYANGRSADALALSRALLAQARGTGERSTVRRATTACGLLLADVADVVGAVGHHVEALRIAEEDGDAIEASRTWTNLGSAFAGGGNHALAVQCFRRALARIEAEPDPLFSRFAALTNLASLSHHGGRVEEGLVFANRALHELTPAIQEQDPHAVLLLKRNLARLLIDAGSLEEAAVQVADVARLAEAIRTPRALIAAATTHAAQEIALGRFDVALTRLDQALARAREVPAVLRDTLACVIRAEEAAGNAERALVRLHELSDHVYRESIERARQQLEVARLDLPALEAGDPVQEQAKARLLTRISPPSEPGEWRTLQRLAMGAALRFEPTGQHGVRVGAVTKALALAAGRPPLEALEIGLAAELHDIGMLSVPEAILQKQGELNEVERALLQRHTEAGAEILRDDRHPRMLMAREIAKYHHADWDGNGHPARVGGSFIPLPARLCAVADAYDTMVCGAAGRGEHTMDEALAGLDRVSGTQLDPDLVRCFGTMIRSEAENRGLDPSSVPGSEAFGELVASLQEDRGFM